MSRLDARLDNIEGFIAEIQQDRDGRRGRPPRYNRDHLDDEDDSEFGGGLRRGPPHGPAGGGDGGAMGGYQRYNSGHRPGRERRTDPLDADFGINDFGMDFRDMDGMNDVDFR
jgi:hypothetical protein